jgi:hypothetical protein
MGHILARYSRRTSCVIMSARLELIFKTIFTTVLILSVSKASSSCLYDPLIV